MREQDRRAIIQYLDDLRIEAETYAEVSLTFRAGRLTFASAKYTDRFDLPERPEPPATWEAEPVARGRNHRAAVIRSNGTDSRPLH